MKKLKFVKKWVRGLDFSDIFVVPSPTKFKKQHYMEVIVEGHLKEVDNIISLPKCPICIGISFSVLSLTCCYHWCPGEPLKYEMGAGFRKIPASAQQDWHFTRSLNVIRYRIRALSIMKIKLTGNSFPNEKDRRTNHILSKMSPKVI